MTSLTGATTCALLECALRSSSIVAPCTQHIRSSISHTALTESSYKTRCSFGISQSCFLKEIGAEALVIWGSKSVGDTLYWECEHTSGNVSVVG